MCLLAALWVQLSVSAGNGWPHDALQHQWLMPISCHFGDCKALLVTSLTHVSGAIANVQTFTFTFGLAATRRSHQRSHPTPGPVSAWVGNCLRTGKPPQRRTKHRGLFSLSQPPVGRRNEYPAKAEGVKGTSRVTRIRGIAVQAGVWLKS